MYSSRQPSEHSMKRTLYDSLRKQRQLSNRINVLLIEKQKKLKVIQRRINMSHQEQQLRCEKHLRREQIEHSLNHGKQDQLNKSRVFRQTRQDLNTTINFKQSQLRQTRRQCYKQMKKHHISNHQKIHQKKHTQLEANLRKTKQVKLMEINSKQNIKKYWDDRVDVILESKVKEESRKNRIFEDSMNSISVLEERERKLLEDIRNSTQYEQRIKSEPYEVVYVDEKPVVTWRNSKNHDINDSS